MKRLFYIACLGYSLLLAGCPYSSSYKLDDAPSIYVEDVLLGSWACFVKKPGNDREEPVKLILSKKNDTEYNIAFTGYLDELKPFRILTNDTLKGTAYMSTLLGHQFLNIEIKARTYIAELQFENNTLSLLPLAEHFTSRIVHSSEALKQMLEFHYKSRTHPMFDEDFCLKDMVKVN
jgi:hypothetical protein